MLGIVDQHMTSPYADGRCLIDDSLLAPRPSVSLNARGMTCHACVNNIQDTMRTQPGIHSCKVSLENAEEVCDEVVRKPSASPAKDSLVRFSKPEKIEMSMTKSKQNGELGCENLEKCTLAVEGMTCASCVQYIERNIGKLKGVQSIVVALIAGKAEINYNPSLTSVEKLIAEMTALGYRASLIDSPFSAFSKIHLTIGGLNSEVDVNRIESHVISKTGVESCNVSLATSVATVEFSPSQIGPRDLISVIEALGYTAELSSKDDQMRRLDHSEEVRNKEELLQNPIASCLKYLVTKFHHQVSASDGFNVSETVVRTLKTKNINGVLKLWIARN
ncbi:unnamed protein product [Heligmosomoides polygyrus]|uniref:HMA domain-containing protein n=1 Tax=Heligmosomoides polygyrus TaxID=6339 RepID=A0A3P8E5Z9_HELPZ|nr:unnamed protein product [Heligmosomoides polygyrus]